MSFKVFVIGSLMYLLCNMFWQYLPHGETVYWIGLAVGVCLMIWDNRDKYQQAYKQNRDWASFQKYLFVDFIFNLAVTKCFTEVFLDGFIVHPYEYWGLVISILIIIFRIKYKL